MRTRFYTPFSDLPRRLLVPLTLLVTVGGVYAAAVANSLESDLDRYRLPAWGPTSADESQPVPHILGGRNGEPLRCGCTSASPRK